MSENIPYLVAHRGYMKAYPENTRRSISEAIGRGACFVEFDVQCTLDEQLIVLHDETLQRTTDQTGCVFELSYAELMTASAHQPDRFGDRFAGEPIVTLEQMMQTVCESTACHAFVEIKEESLQHYGHQRLMSRLLDNLKSFQHRYTVISFDQLAIQHCIEKGIKTGWVLHEYDLHHLTLAQRLNPDYLICNFDKLDKQAPWSGPWQWMLYDIVDPQLALDFANKGVDFIETEALGEMIEHPMLKRKRCSDASL